MYNILLVIHPISIIKYNQSVKVLKVYTNEVKIKSKSK